MATKNGPAAPVSLSPQRSTRLKQEKTKRGQAPGMMRVIEGDELVFNKWSSSTPGVSATVSVVIGSKLLRSSTTPAS